MKSVLTVSAFLSSVFCLRTLASVALCNSQDYELGVLGLTPLQTYNAAPFSLPQINYVIPPTDCPSNTEVEGYIFYRPLWPHGTVGGDAFIMNPNGTLVYSALQDTIDDVSIRLGIQSFKGEDHLAIWLGALVEPGYGSGYNLLLDNTYTIVANITTAANLDVGADLHELQITSNDTAIMTAYTTQATNLSDFGGPEDGFVLNGAVQEVDIATGEALFTWHALDQIDLSESFTNIGEVGVGNGTRDNPWDFFHINSIQKLDDGNYFISSRHCHTLYLVSPSGEVIWRMGGKISDFTFGPGANFSWQHHARMHDSRTISVFNNGATGWEQDFPFSQGLLFKYDMSFMTAQGSVQLLEDRYSLVGWGQQPYFSQHDEHGEILWSAQFGLNSTAYRVFFHDWVGRPKTPPSVHVSNTSSFTNVTIYAWWNDATEITAWQLLGANASSTAKNYHSSKLAPLGDPVGKLDFETTLTYNGGQGYYELYQVAALNSSGHALGYSNVTSLDGTSSFKMDTSLD
ncbi:hypothetical protein GYMLUDRAFT_251327 [Collybiopsis luxurians FD-317 M1]|uniref:ASST-domain-containing protein n=1 Tax=Collybiopsis luxurians FD-317 M1 TaxID=944289 RepID=A0A0D0CBL6_9AGAR|nr:hypothetical protein GYMLUDRAFT_251327 [Collybiopsis luxurians FD-317 M1]